MAKGEIARFEQFLAPLAESQSSLCHGELSVIRFLQEMLIGRKTWLPGGGAILPYIAIVKT